MSITRRRFLATAVAGGTVLAAAGRPAFAQGGGPLPKIARWRRYDVACPEGQRMLVSYERGVRAMLALPPEDPRNWFRYAFTHFFDCPHGNWWFYAWHRGYVGYFERIIRELSGDIDFAMPYWDWTRQPEIPASMFSGALTPTDVAFAPYTRNLKVFTDFIKPALQRYWATLSPQQLQQLSTRGYTSLDLAWNDVTGYVPAQKTSIAGNMAFAITCGARYLSPDNPRLDASTRVAVSSNTITAGLKPQKYYDPSISLSFTSSRTATHLMQPDSATKFSILEGQPHNLVHNCIGGVGAIDYGPYGNMTNFLSPVDPIFFLHHANMDRLWHVWTQKQLAQKLPIAPEGADLEPFMTEPFLFYTQANGTPVGPSSAAAVFTTDAFDYDYASGSGSDYRPRTKLRRPPPPATATIDEDSATVALTQAMVERHLADTQGSTLIAEITFDRPEALAAPRSFDVLVNAPADVTRAAEDSPYYAGTLAFFGPGMPGMQMSHTTTFTLPLPRTLPAFRQLQDGTATLDIRLVPRGDFEGEAPKVSAVTIVSVD
jgi:tyrosinase